MTVTLAPTPATWTEGLPPIPTDKTTPRVDVYLLDGPEWGCPALVQWSWNDKLQSWYLMFHDIYVYNALGPYMDDKIAMNAHGYLHIYLYDANKR